MKAGPTVTSIVELAGGRSLQDAAGGEKASPNAEIWHSRIDALAEPGLVRRCHRLLAIDERHRVERFVREADRRRALLARAMARTVLAGCVGADPKDLRFTYNAYGKPALAPEFGEGVHFNVSHSGAMVVCAVSREGEIGVDIEDRRRTVEFCELARNFFSAEEAAAVERAPEHLVRRRFYEIWTLKEAFVKARGRGLSIPLDSFAMSLSGKQEPAIRFIGTSETSPEEWGFAQRDWEEGFQLGLAVRLGRANPLIVTTRPYSLPDEKFFLKVPVPCQPPSKRVKTGQQG